MPPVPDEPDYIRAHAHSLVQFRMSARFDVCKVIRPAKGEGQDCAVVIEVDDSLVIAVADGAGGMAGGREAADAVIRAAIEAASTGPVVFAPSHWEKLIRTLDAAIAADRIAGETTAVLVAAAADVIAGASVGDSEAWLILDGQATMLTADQNRKPLVGSGRARPVGFGPIPFQGRLVAGSDGLFKYCRHDRLLSIAMCDPLDVAATALVSEIQLPSGGLQDDAVVVLCQARHSPEP
jgi:PPM family protein phosphatase